MNLVINAVCHGFKVLQTQFVEEINSQAYIMEHVQSGARLFYLANDDDNKVFSISFRTPPADDSGVAHILEHSSLCGSRKYHLKEPFVDLVKGSLNTFLNAMTYPDKTMYPVASRNDKDFHNLMDVYLDAVFYPLIYENKYTLRQEGWHYNIDSLEGELSYNGVVYNEMKGVYSSADAYLENEGMKALFPDNCYRFESGGYPDAIPQLTQEKFEQFHKTYYSPENSYIYLYGDMDIEATLAYLDGEYLSHFSKTGMVDSQITPQAPLARTAEVEAFYPVGADEDCSGKTYHELSIVTAKATDIQTVTALGLLKSVLLDGESSPLRRALLAAGVGQTISGSFVPSMLQPVFSIRASGSEKNQRDKFVSVIYKTLQDITINGLDKKLLEANLNSLEFKLRESDFGGYPKGLIIGISIMDSWLYGGNPINSISYNKYLQALRAGINSNYFESLIENYLLDNTHKAIVTLLPQPGKEESDQAAAAEKMRELRTGMSKEQLQKYIDECAELHRLQAEPDSEEARASIPVLKRSDIRQAVEQIEAQEEAVGESRLLYLPRKTNKIAYTSFYFDITDIPSEQLPLCYLLTDILGKFDTKRYSYQELSTNAIMYTGGVSFNVRAYTEAESTEQYKIYFAVKGKCLVDNLPHMLDLLQAIGTESKLDSLERLQELVAELKTDWDDNFFNRGQTVAITRLYSYCSSGARVNEQDEFTYYQFLKQLVENFASEAPGVLAQLQALISRFFEQSRFVLTYSCDMQDKESVRTQCLDFISKLPKAKIGDTPQLLPVPATNEAITTAGKVQYVAAGGSFGKYGHKYVGAMAVLETILRYEYLWTKIRIQGGAYGATARFELNGVGVFASYRDPQLEKSLQAYKDLAAWLRTVEFPERELNKYVIGTISGMDTPLTNSMRVDKVAAQYLKHVPQELRQRIRNEVLNVTNEDLQSLGQVVEDMLSDGLICVVGGKQPIEANKELFNTVISA